MNLKELFKEKYTINGKEYSIGAIFTDDVMSQMLIHAAKELYDSKFIDVDAAALNIDELLKTHHELKGSKAWYYIKT